MTDKSREKTIELIMALYDGLIMGLKWGALLALVCGLVAALYELEESVAATRALVSDLREQVFDAIGIIDLTLSQPDGESKETE